MTPLTAAKISDRTHAFLAAVNVAPDVLELHPDYRVLVLVAEGLQPGAPDQISAELLARAETRAQISLGGRVPEDVPQIADWRAAYRAFGAKPQRTRPSAEALLRRLDAGLPRIGHLTDACNAVLIIDGLAAPGPGGLAAAGHELASSLVRLSPQAAIASRLIAADQPAPGGQDAGDAGHCAGGRHG